MKLLMDGGMGMMKTLYILSLCIMLIGLSGCLNAEYDVSEPVENTGVSTRTFALVTEVVDGDTITVSGGERIRLIGIDAPETDEQYYEESKAYLKDKILYQEVELESDITNKDVYGRSLRYVWFNNELLNAEIVREGLAIAKQYDPDTKYENEIAEAESEAIGRQVGLWADIQTSTSSTGAQDYAEDAVDENTPSPTVRVLVDETVGNNNNVISYLDADSYIGEIKTVEGTIVDTFKYTKGNVIFLNFHDPYEGYFTAIIWSSDWSKFPMSPDIYYKYKKVRVTGEIIEYKGSSEIVVDDPSQIEIVS